MRVEVSWCALDLHRPDPFLGLELELDFAIIRPAWPWRTVLVTETRYYHHWTPSQTTSSSEYHVCSSHHRDRWRISRPQCGTYPLGKGCKSSLVRQETVVCEYLTLKYHILISPGLVGTLSKLLPVSMVLDRRPSRNWISRTPLRPCTYDLSILDS